MKHINISKILESDNAATRADAREILSSLESDSELDLSNIRYISSAFIDELINNLPSETIDQAVATAPEPIQKMFEAVKSRRIAV